MIQEKALLELCDVTLFVGAAKLLDQVSLELKHGECLSIVGPNGAGKTTLLRVIVGLLRGYSGSVKIDGTEVRGLSHERLSHLVSLVPQRLEFLPSFSVREFLELSGLEKTEQSLSLVRHLEERCLPQLSAGELQRVLIAGAVAQGAKVLVLDEPTANVDPIGRRDIEEVLRNCREDMGLSYILVTHDISLALRCTDRTALMKAGRLVWSGATRDPALVQQLSACYGCNFIELKHADLSAPIIVPT